MLTFVLVILEVYSFLSIKYAYGSDDMPDLLNFCRKLGWQLITNPDLVEERVEQYQLAMKVVIPSAMLLVMHASITTIITSAMSSKYTIPTIQMKLHFMQQLYQN